MRIGSNIAFGSAVALLAIACGSGDDSSFGNDSNASADSVNQGGGGSFDTTGTNGSATQVDPVSAVGEKCAGTSAGLNGLPLRLVLLLDKSGSMGDKLSGGSTKWADAKNALKSFFSAAESAGTTVDVIPFPYYGAACSAQSYSKGFPGFSGKLPEGASTLNDMIDGIQPSGGTPTNPAIQGAIEYAKGLQQALKGKEIVSLVLATDGLPEGCSSNTVADVAKTVADVKDELKTYVIGLGNNLNNLNTIAQGAGTNDGKAFLVTSSSTSIAADLTKALGTIRTAALTCNYALPAAPEGKVLDFRQVNVVYGTTDNQTVLVKHSADCADPNGWRYDNEDAPKEILLCSGSCTTVKGTTVKTLDVVLGCATNSSVPVN